MFLLFRKLTSALPALFLLLVAMGPSAVASGPLHDGWYHSTSPMPDPGSKTCHSTGACTTSTGYEAFHNDEAGVVTVWARNTGTDEVDYWQCIEPGQYSGVPGTSPDPTTPQGSIDGGWTHSTSSPYLGDFEWRGNNYRYEWYDDCFQPCVFPFVLECVFLTPFKEDEPEPSAN